MPNQRSTATISLILLFLFPLTARASGAVEPSHPDTIKTQAESGDLLETTVHLARMLVSDALEIVRTPARVRQKDLPLLLVLSGGLVTLISQDDQVRDWIQSDRYVLLDRNRDILEPLGRVSVNQQICGALYLTGYFTENTRLRRIGALGWESSVFTVIVTSFLKHLFGRQRPVAGRGSRYFEMFGEGSSFPSSHAAQAFSLASVVADEYGAPTSYFSYGAASLIALSRMREDLQWASDTMAGALVGILVAKTLCRLHPSKKAGSNSVSPRLRLTAGTEGQLISLCYYFR